MTTEQTPAQQLVMQTSYLASMVFDGSDRCGEAIIVWLRSCNQDAKWLGSTISFSPMWGSGLLRKGQELVRTIGNEFYIREE